MTDRGVVVVSVVVGMAVVGPIVAGVGPLAPDRAHSQLGTTTAPTSASVVQIDTDDPLVRSNASSARSPTAEQADQTDDGSPRSMGAALTSFMQTTAAETDTTVETELWEVSFNRSEATNKQRLIERRTRQLDRRLSRLREELSDIENGTGPGAGRSGRMISVVAQLRAVREAVNRTAATARDANIENVRLEELRQTVANTRVLDVTAELPVDEPSVRPGSPPNETGGDGNGGPLEDRGGPGNETGPPGDRGGSGNETGSTGSGNGSNNPGNGGGSGNGTAGGGSGNGSSGGNAGNGSGNGGNTGGNNTGSGGGNGGSGDVPRS